MASEPFKPLLNRRLLDDARGGHILPLDDEQQRIVASQATSAGNGSLLSQKEKPLQGQFLSQVCDRLLGYRQIVSGEGIHRMEPETNSNAVKGYRPPDARLGWYGSGVDRTRAVLELKAPGADVDAEQGGSQGRLTPVEQAFGHAAKVDGCRWVLVSNERSHAQPYSALGRNYLATVPSRASLELLCVTGPLARVSDARS